MFVHFELSQCITVEAISVLSDPADAVQKSIFGKLTRRAGVCLNVAWEMHHALGGASCNVPSGFGQQSPSIIL
jgi:hypothetical protein